MKESTPIGMNRTGVQMSPFDTSEMASATSSATTPRIEGDATALADMRSAYIAESDPVGSVPIPGTIRGAITTGVSMMIGNSPQLLLDKLGERLAFERTGTRLYDALITKVMTMQDELGSMDIDALRQIRDEEAKHFLMIKNAIETMGGDPTSQTPCADLVGVESTGLMQVVTDPRTTIAQSLHAMLVAEMTDNNGWELLIALADQNGQGTLVNEFTVALNEERSHLIRIQKWFEEATIGASVTAGTSGEIGTPTQIH